jgi:hypothetical protein
MLLNRVYRIDNCIIVIFSQTLDGDCLCKCRYDGSKVFKYEWHSWSYFIFKDPIGVKYREKCISI